MDPHDKSRVPELSVLLEEEYVAASFIPLRDAMHPFLVSPYLRMIQWPYSQGRGLIPCWIVAELGEMTLAFSEFGHGAYGNRWGIVKAEDQMIQRDDSWFLRLEDAFINAGAWTGSLPKEYEIR